MTIACIIPARQFSHGVPAKNRAAFSATLACALTLTQTVILATDDPVLVRLARTPVIHIPRPAELEDGPLEAVVAHAVQHIPSDLVVVLQPSSPSQRRELYAQAAIDVLFREAEASSVVSVVPWIGEPPQKAVYVRGGQLTIPAPVRRQDCAPAYRRDGTVYAVRGTYARQGDLYGPRPVPLLVTPSDSVTVD